MDDLQLTLLLKNVPLGPIRCFDVLDSTNDEAERWIDQGAPDLALVVADEQTSGRGRLDRRWLTPPGVALAFSLILRDTQAVSANLDGYDTTLIRNSRMTGLGALAVCEVLAERYGLMAQIKWPNDVLLEGCKTAGILAETVWHSSQPVAVILGIGINISHGSVPPAGSVRFPATCVQDAMRKPIDRFELLRSVLESLILWRDKVDLPAFIQTWDEKLAYKGEWVEILQEPGTDRISAQQACLLGLDSLGRLRLQDGSGSVITLDHGEISLRALKK
jgi:BirA family transcriptional regulator, biotin operon repressor / biotin---[acetyl-CoA-carboxylase] ligase